MGMMEGYVLVILFLFGIQKNCRCDDGVFSFESSKVILLSGSNELDSNKYDLTQQISVLQYKFYGNTDCTEVKYDGKTVWKKDGSSYPHGLFLKTGGEIVVAMKDRWNIYLLEDGQWKLKSHEDMNTVELDINKKESCSQYLYSKIPDCELYHAHAGYYFNLVKEGGETVFNEHNSVDYARKVKLGVDSGSQKLELELLSGVVRVYKKQNDGSWTCNSGCGKSNGIRGSRRTGNKFNTTLIIVIVAGVVLLLFVAVLIFMCKK